MILKRFIAVLSMMFVVLAAATAQYKNSEFNILPTPSHLQKHPGTFVIDELTRVHFTNAGGGAARHLQAYFEKTFKVHLRLGSGTHSGIAKAKQISLVLVNGQDASLEGYELNVSPSKIVIKGSAAGLFYGIQTLIQLVMEQKQLPAAVPCLNIKDKPRFPYRGFMLDVSRHFSSVKEVKQLLNMMAMYKMNTLHWHLTDNQGWRIQIKRYLKLTTIGSTGNHTNTLAPPTYYTQQQIKEVVKYAADRHIKIIPEIEMPGHSKALLAAYPNLRCESADTASNAPYKTVFCPTEETFTFLQNVLQEVMELFPGKHIHIGGDEVNKIPWKQSAYSQGLIKRLALRDEHGLQSYFISRIEKFVNSKGKSIVGWDEILQGGLAPNATVMSWQGEQGGIAAAKQKHNVIMTPRTSGLYFDFPQSTHPDERFISLTGTLKDIYHYNPVPNALNNLERNYILGVQSNLWTERLPTPASRQYMIFPRLMALAEIGWTDLTRKNYTVFKKALSKQLQYLDHSGINYRVPTASADTTIVTGSIEYQLERPFDGCKIYYTLNGKAPSDTDEEYVKPIKLIIPVGRKTELKTIVVTPYGRRSLVTTISLINNLPQVPVEVNRPRPGLHYSIYTYPIYSLHEIKYLKVSEEGSTENLKPKPLANGGNLFTVVYEGLLKIEKDDVYTFRLGTQESSTLSIDDEQIIENNKSEYPFGKETSLKLKAGFHKIAIQVLNLNAKSNLIAEMKDSKGVYLPINSQIYRD